MNNLLPQPNQCANPSCNMYLAPYQKYYCSLDCMEACEFERPNKTRKAVYWYVIAHANVHTYTPPHRQIGTAVGISTSVAFYHVKVLAKHGLLELDSNGKIVIPGSVLMLPPALELELARNQLPFEL